MKLKTFIYGLLFIFLSISCRKETTYQMEIILQNDSDSELDVTLFPKSDYICGHFYNYSDFFDDCADTTFILEINDDKSLFLSSNLNQTPFDLVSKIFDSIYINPLNGNQAVMKFSSNKVVGYPENLFDSNSTWVYEKRNYGLKTNLSTQPIESNNYTFIISFSE